MIRIRYLTLLMLLLGSIGSWGQAGGGFDPSNPPEPGQPPMKLQVKVNPSEAGSVNGTGLYVEGASVDLRAYVNTGFRFVSWTNSVGDVLSTSTSFTYTKQAGHEMLTANYVFDPSNPSEPDDPASIMYFQLQVNATEGGTASGGGRYLANQSVTLSAYTQSQFDFVGWIDDASGETISTETSFRYTTTAKHCSITAQFKFNPDSPQEPPMAPQKRTVTATPTEGGTTNFSSKRETVGNSISFQANANSGYDFEGWYLNGELYTVLSSFSYTVTEAYGQDFVARFKFNPANPGEPNTPTTTKHSIFLMNKVTKPGRTVKFPVYLSSVSTLTDMTFQLEFPEELTPDFENVEMSEKAMGYTISYNKQDDRNYIFTLTGGSVPAGNSALLVFTIHVADDILTGQDYPVKINLVEVTEEDQTVTTASTRNGRISVYKNGDANGDNVVDEQDASLILQYVAHKFGDENTDFIKEAADANNENEVDALDASLVLQHVAGKIDINEMNQSE